MRALLYIISVCCWLWPAYSLANNQTGMHELPSITVLADRALTVPLSQIASQYSRTNHVSVTLSFAPSFEQTVAIEEGEPADIYISAQPKSLDKLKQQGLFDVYSITPIVKSRMALISTTRHHARVNEITEAFLKQLRMEPDFLLSVATPAATAEGYYAQEIIDKVKPKLFLSSRTAILQNTEEMLNFMQDTPSYGITFVPYALQNDKIKNLGVFPEEMHSPVLFKGVVIAGGQMQLARKFLQYLKTAEAQRNFIKYRFYGVNDG